MSPASKKKLKRKISASLQAHETQRKNGKNKRCHYSIKGRHICYQNKMTFSTLDTETARYRTSMEPMATNTFLNHR